jgi:hypothetical protein
LTGINHKRTALRVVRILAWTVAGLLALIVVTWLALLLYVNRNERQLIEKVKKVIEKRTRGETEIGGLSVSFFRTFPILSLQLEDVIVRDSLYHQHRLNLLNASDIYLKASISGLFRNRVPVSKVIIRNGNINFFTDQSGSTNEFVLKSGKERDADDPFEMPNLELKDVTIQLGNLQRNKFYKAVIHSLHCTGKKRKDRLVFGLNLKMQVKNIAFNTKTGSYLREKPVSGKFRIEYFMPKKHLIVHQVRLNLDGHPFLFDGYFGLSKAASDFRLQIKANHVSYKRATSFLREPLEKKMNEYSVSEPMNMQVLVSGKTAVKSQPLVQVNVDVNTGKVGTPLGEFDKCSLQCSFTKQLAKKNGRVDENSQIHLKNFTGTWEHILVKSKNIKISNLITPFLDCDIASDVDLKSLNDLAGSSSLQFLDGKASVDVVFKGPLVGKDSAGSTITGDIGIYDASMKYLPRKFTLSNCNGKLRFENNDLTVNKLTADAGKTQIVMKGIAKNFLTMLNISPEKLYLVWEITSPSLHLEDFKPFLSKGAADRKDEKTKAKFGQTASKIDKLFAEGDMFISLKTPAMDYKSFKATDVEARVILKKTEIAFDQVQLKHAGGAMTASGALSNGDKFNPVTLQTKMENMDIPTLFSAFENFGQDAVTYKNLKGTLNANVVFRTGVNNEAKLISEANEGVVTFLLQNGELNNFEPLMEISKKAFKKQDFSSIKFADLENKLEIRGTTFIVNEMDIRSTALNLTVEGIYDVKKGTDMSIRLPLTNLTKSQASTDISDDGKAKKGVSLRLRARTGDDGKLKISWDPFRRGKKKKDEVQESTMLEQEE